MSRTRISCSSSAKFRSARCKGASDRCCSFQASSRRTAPTSGTAVIRSPPFLDRAASPASSRDRPLPIRVPGVGRRLQMRDGASSHRPPPVFDLVLPNSPAFTPTTPGFNPEWLQPGAAGRGIPAPRAPQPEAPRGYPTRKVLPYPSTRRAGDAGQGRPAPPPLGPPRAARGRRSRRDGLPKPRPRSVRQGRSKIRI